MRPIFKSLTIFCEGTVTEPQYFADLREEVQKKVPDYVIEISPIPPIQNYEEENEQSYKRPAAKRRNIIEVEVEPQHNFVPLDFKAQPLEYVWKARESLKVHGEAWAIFDRDEHPALEEAFELAKQPVDAKLVNIAFSSRSFEFWLLLHFEKRLLPFSKTTCRTRTRTGKGKNAKKKDKYHECGEDKGNELDCKGEVCITGYLKENDFIAKDSDIKNSRFKEAFKDNVYIAIKNAIELRSKIGYRGTHAIDTLDPYTDVDRLVFKLLNIEFDYQWVSYETIKDSEISYEITVSDNMLNFEIKNNSEIAFVLDPDKFALLDVQNNAINLLDNRRTLLPGEETSVSFDTNEYEEFFAVFFRFPMNKVEVGILELRK
ncbi:RloB family protein [Chryseobacterium oncorhynchi]|uniref:RloB domain-containing protein n=1 Tax=Chryseobacterium oncorhynchi TaxID=741074 RepID=A0A316X1T0_9FLAO|nr:RloB family protein [Chryseobacterium oncorhynchi]PWN67645.1 hypothetical protein C1638_003370 [Chryseobacterium oncorhynchi]